MSETTRALGRAFSGILKGIARLTRRIGDSLDSVVDFAYVKVFGLPFIVLGYRQTGKTTLIEWLRHDMEALNDFNPDPTAAGGDAVPVFTTHADAEGKGMRLKPKRDVGGEYSMWETDWVELLRQTQPRGIIFLIDHTNTYQHKDALNFVLNLLEDEEQARKPLRMFLLLANKSDLWADEQTLDELLDDFRNETRRLKSQAERLGYAYRIGSSSLVTEQGIREELVAFFDAIRPRSRQEEKARANGRGG
jgi:GTPase SAR1 family protein